MGLVISKKDRPIIKSLLDTDFYKDTMGKLIQRRFPKVPVKFAFKNRHKHVRLAECIDQGELREQLDHCMKLRFCPQEIHYLLGTYEYNRPMFGLDYGKFMQDFRLPEYHLETRDGQLHLEFFGEWQYVTRWETLAMQIVAELYGRHQLRGLSRFEREVVFAEGRRRLARKIKVLKANPNIVFSDFGTRRRFSRRWQQYVVSVLAQEFPRPSAFVDHPQFRGTSNTWLAMKYGLTPMGTNAHELPMVYSAIFRKEDNAAQRLVSQIKMLEDWETEYGEGLSIFLPDTYGSDYFFNNIPVEMIARWKGSRHDSGPAMEYGDKRIPMYRDMGVDPAKKIIVFADGQDPWQADSIEKYFRGRIIPSFGIGTNFTNDLGFTSEVDLKALSIVVKVIEACGLPVCKLSDNIEKAIGNPAEIERMKQLVGYGVTYAESCRY